MRRLGLLKPATQARPERAFLRLSPPSFPSVGFWPRRAAFEYPSTIPLAYPAKTCWRVVSGGSVGIAGLGYLCRRHGAKRQRLFCLWLFAFVFGKTGCWVRPCAEGEALLRAADRRYHLLGIDHKEVFQEEKPVGGGQNHRNRVPGSGILSLDVGRSGLQND